MKWEAKNSDGWRRRFAFLPISAGGETVWLEWYWARWAGDYTEVRFHAAHLPDRDGGAA